MGVEEAAQALQEANDIVRLRIQRDDSFIGNDIVRLRIQRDDGLIGNEYRGMIA